MFNKLVETYLPYPELAHLLIYPILVIILASYSLYARHRNHRLKLPVGLFICYFAVMSALKLTEHFDLPSIFGILELVSTIFLTLAIIRFVTFIFVDYLMRYKKLAPIPVISRDIGLVLVYLIAILMVLRYQANVNLTSIITTSAVLTAVIGLALQDTLGNLISGIVLQMEKPYNIGDWVSFDNYVGRVIGMTWKSTRIITREKEMVSIPNNTITKSHILNYTQPDPNHVATLYVGVSYKDPPNDVREVILTTISEHPSVNPFPSPEVRVIKYNDFSVDYEVRFSLSDFENEPKIKSHILNQIWYRFKRRGLTIPFPIRTIHQERFDPEKEAVARDQAMHRALANLKRVDVFDPLSENDLANIARQVRFEQFSAGEIIISEGDAGTSMYVIVRGECEVIIFEGKNKEHIIARLGAGEFFGEMSLLTGEPRTATVRAGKDMICLRIEKEDLEEIMNAHPEVAEAMSVMLAARKEGLTQYKDTLKEAAKLANKKLASQFLTKIKKFFNIT